MAIRTGLPAGDAPSLKLIPATPEQAKQTWALNGASWKGPLTEEAYYRREQHLASQPLTANGGVTYWILVDENDPNESDPTILSSCETYRKKAFVARKDRPGEIEEVVSHGIGSVFCRDEFRGKGYAGRMMQELAERLKTWQQGDGKAALFNVLYSDIGKKFYARRGWVPFPSSHVDIPVTNEGTIGGDQLASTRPVYAKELRSLCEADVAQLRKGLPKFDVESPKVRVAFVPEYNAMQWQHSREEFVSQEVFKRHPEVKGAIVDSKSGDRVWCTWLRVFDQNPADSTLHITRLVVENSKEFIPETHSNITHGPSGTLADHSRINAIAACIRAACLEASEWQIGRVQIWNPAAATLDAVRSIGADVKLVDRKEESIASLLWYGSEVSPDELEWVGNEKYGWC